MIWYMRRSQLAGAFAWLQARPWLGAFCELLTVTKWALAGIDWLLRLLALRLLELLERLELLRLEKRELLELNWLLEELVLTLETLLDELELLDKLERLELLVLRELDTRLDELSARSELAARLELPGNTIIWLLLLSLLLTRLLLDVLSPALLAVERGLDAASLVDELLGKGVSVESSLLLEWDDRDVELRLLVLDEDFLVPPSPLPPPQALRVRARVRFSNKA